MKLPKVPALKCDSNFFEIVYFEGKSVQGKPTDDDWLKLAFSITEKTKVHECCLEYPFLFSGSFWSSMKPIMSNCVSTFRNYCLVTAMATLWNSAASRPFGTKECMQELSKVYKLSTILHAQDSGMVPETHPLVHKEIQSLIEAIANIKAISVMSSDDALTEDQCHRRFNVRCEIWRLLLMIDAPFWSRLVSQLIQEQKQELADLFIKVIMRFSRWRDVQVGDMMAEAKLLIPFSTLTEKKALEIRDLARLHTSGAPIGIASNIKKQLPPDCHAALFLAMKPACLEMIEPLFTLKQISD